MVFYIKGRISTDEFRLFGGRSPREGRLQIKHADTIPDGPWSTVCSDDVDATVAFALCARIGYKMGCDFGQAVEFVSTDPAADLGPIENVNFNNCLRDVVPYELDCNLFAFSGSTCSHSQDVWLRCTSGN